MNFLDFLLRIFENGYIFEIEVILELRNANEEWSIVPDILFEAGRSSELAILINHFQKKIKYWCIDCNLCAIFSTVLFTFIQVYVVLLFNLLCEYELSKVQNLWDHNH